MALEDPLMKKFGGDKLINAMKSMKMKEEESIQHSAISKSIVRAQQKLQSNKTGDLRAKTAQEWIDLNVR